VERKRGEGERNMGRERVRVRLIIRRERGGICRREREER
jgi:hypothetical protein